MVFNKEVWNVLKVWGAGQVQGGGVGGAGSKGMDKNIEWGGCDPQQNDGMYLFQLHDSKEF